MNKARRALIDEIELIKTSRAYAFSLVSVAISLFALAVCIVT